MTRALTRVACIAAIVIACVACSHQQPVSFRRAQAFIEGNRRVAWTLHVTLVASDRPDERQVLAQMRSLGRIYRGQAHLRRIVADIDTETDGKTIATASAAMRPSSSDDTAPMGAVTVRWTT